MLRSFSKDFSLNAVIAAILALTVSYAGSAVIIFQAARSAGLSPELTTSWIWAVSIGSGLTGLILSWKLKNPIATAWSTPGAALLVTVLPKISYQEAIGAYIVSALIITVIGLTGSLDKIMKHLPAAVSAGMFAGILFGFGAKLFSAVPEHPLLVGVMFAVFIVVRRFFPRFAVVAAICAGILIIALSNGFIAQDFNFAFARPVFTFPAWSLTSIISVALPLTLVTLTGQYIAGLAVLKASGYQVKTRPVMTVTGIASLLLAPFGAHAINLASLTAGICAGPEAHEQPERRYIAGIILGVLYLVIGLFGQTIVSLFSSFPAAFIAALAGLALIATFATALRGMINDSGNLESGIIAFLVTASGMSFLGLSAPFWGIALGGVAYLILRKRT